MGAAINSSNAASGINTDILTYSLTNTYTTIESLHEELATIKGEMSQKRGSNVLKSMQRYAREIQEGREEENVSGEEEDGEEEEKVELWQEEGFIKEIQSYYNRIHEEVG